MPLIEIHRKKPSLDKVLEKIGQEEIDAQKRQNKFGFDDEEIQQKQTELDKLVATLRMKSQDPNSGVKVKGDKGRIRANLVDIYSSQEKAQQSAKGVGKAYREMLADLRQGGNILDADFKASDMKKPDEGLLHKLRYASPSAKESNPITSAKQTSRKIRDDFHTKLDAGDETISSISENADPRPAGELLELLERRKQEKQKENEAERSENAL